MPGMASAEGQMIAKAFSASSTCAHWETKQQGGSRRPRQAETRSTLTNYLCPVMTKQVQFLSQHKKPRSSNLPENAQPLLGFKMPLS